MVMKSFLLILLFFGFSFSQLSAALTGYLKIPDIPGESQAAGHEEEIDIHDISWGVFRPKEGDSGSTRTRSTAVFEDLIVIKELDKSSPKLMEACANGRVFPEIVISLKKDSGEAHLDYLVITLTNVMVTSYDINGSSQSGVPSSSAGFNYEELKVTYTEFDDTGTSKGNVEVTWKVEEGES